MNKFYINFGWPKFWAPSGLAELHLAEIYRLLMYHNHMREIFWSLQIRFGPNLAHKDFGPMLGEIGPNHERVRMIDWLRVRVSRLSPVVSLSMCNTTWLSNSAPPCANLILVFIDCPGYVQPISIGCFHLEQDGEESLVRVPLREQYSVTHCQWVDSFWPWMQRQLCKETMSKPLERASISSC